MKHIRSILGLLLATISVVCYAQDTIIFKNGEELPVIVNEISKDEVKYKKTSNPDGPTYIVTKDNIFMIKFKNGDKEVYGTESNVQANNNELGQEEYINTHNNIEKAEFHPSPYSPMARYQVNRHSESGLATNNGTYYISEFEARQLMGQNYDMFTQYMDKSETGRKILIGGIALRVASVPLILVGIANSLEDYYCDEDYYYDGYYCRHDHETVGNVLLSLGIISRIASYPLVSIGTVKFSANRVRAKKLAKSLNGIPFEPRQYDNISLNIGAKPNGLALSLTF